MGLFDTKYCAICGAKKGLLGTKLIDGTVLCDSCAEKACVSYIKNVDFNPMVGLKQCTIDQYSELVEYKEKNREKLKDFNCTHSYFNMVHIDDDAQEIVFAPSYDLNNDDYIKEDNPPVFRIQDLGFMYTIYDNMEVKEGFLSDKGKADLCLVIGFKDKLYDVFKVVLEKRAKLGADIGLFKSTVYTHPIMDELTGHIINMMEYETIWNLQENDHQIPILDEDLYWSQTSRALTYGYIDKNDVSDLLKIRYKKDKILIREVRRRHGL